MRARLTVTLVPLVVALSLAAALRGATAAAQTFTALDLGTLNGLLALPWSLA